VGGGAGRGGAVKSAANWLAAFWLRRQVALAVLLGRKRRSIELMQAVLRLDPDDADSRNALGNLLVEAGEPAAAVEQFMQLVQRWPDNAEAWFNLGYIHESREDLANAERCFRRALQLNAKIDRAWYGLGLTLIRGGRLAEAVEDADARLRAVDSTQELELRIRDRVQRAREQAERRVREAERRLADVLDGLESTGH